MASSRPKTAFLQGMTSGAPFIFVVAPFSLLFGVVATEAGFSILETIGFSVLVIAGAAQFAAVQVMIEDAPTLIVVLTALAVNMRMAMYSASLAVHLRGATLMQRLMVSYLNVDQSYAAGVAKFEAEPEMALEERIAFFFGVMAPIAPMWYLFTLIGAIAGAAIPPEYALDFALPLCFIAMFSPMLKTAAHLAAAFTSVVMSLLLVWLPFSSGLLVAAALAMIVGAQVELRMKGRAA